MNLPALSNRFVGWGKKIFSLILVVFLTGNGGALAVTAAEEITLAARQIHISGLILQIADIEIFDMNAGAPPGISLAKRATAGGGFLALTLQVFNEENANCRLSDLRQMQFSVFDTTGQPLDLLSKVERPDAKAPDDDSRLETLPVGEVFCVVLYFRVPAVLRQDYQLVVNAAALNISNNLTLDFPSSQVAVVADVNRKRTAEMGDIQILSPQDGQEARKGEELAVEVKIPDTVEKPSRFYVLLPKFTFEDDFVNLKYKIKLPADVSPGPYPIVFMAVWDKTGEPQSMSRSVTLEIVESKDAALSRRMSVPK